MTDAESDEEEMAETAAKLDAALDSSKGEGTDGTGDVADEGDDGTNESDTDDLADPAALVDRAEADIESLLGVLNGNETFAEAKDDIEDLRRVIEETEELLGTVDVTALPGTIELSELPQAIDAEEVPAAIANAEPERAVELTQLASLVEFDELFDSVDVREFMRNKAELEDAVDDATDDEEDDTADASGTDSPDLSNDEDDAEAVDGEMQAKRTALQSKLREAVGEFRESVLDAREQVTAARDTANEKVKEKTGGDIGQVSSRNPTAYSTMTSGWKSGGWSSATYSTVPTETRYSDAPNHVRVYGSRFGDVEVADNEEGDDE